MYKLLGTPDADGFYPAFATSPDYVGQFCSTLEQQVFNAMHTTCPKCRGQGVSVRRYGRTVVRDRAGCSQCLGLGVIPRE